ncbi:MAG: carotenoid biosynthesis protein [Flavobacteriaceae bacterium]
MDYQKQIKELGPIFLIWLFHLSGILGIIYGNAEWFVSATPLNLGISFILLVACTYRTPNIFWVYAIAFAAGMITEYLGVNHGLIFGAYIYGDALGPKIYGVPWFIGVNWSMLTVITAIIATEMVRPFWGRVALGVGLMLFLDLLIEPMAPKLDFWEFAGGKAPLQNYFGWILVALPLHLVFHLLRLKPPFLYAVHLYTLQVLFFLILLMRIFSA